jgi:hypothetical protein
MNLLKDNAYHILGLDTSAGQKEISKRSKEILTRLKIEDVPEYELDLNFFDGFRNEDSVKKAVANLSAPKKQIKEYFFWLQITDSVDEEAATLFRKGKYADAASIWKEHSANESTKSLLYKKNLAIFTTILLYRSKNTELLEKSVALWGELVNSSKFWTAFSKVYKLHDELGSDQDVIEDFKKKVPDYISDIYAELTELHDDKDFVTVFSKNFGLKGEKIETDVLNPIYKVINCTVEDLESLKVGDDGILDETEKNKIKDLISTAQQEFNKLIDLGLYDASQVKGIRDRFASALRTIVLDLHNNLNEVALSEKLMKVGITFCGTESLKSKFEQELLQLNENLTSQNNSVLTLELPGTFSTSYLTFDAFGVEYKNKKIKYADATKVAWHSTRNSTYGVPSGQTYNFLVGSDTETISVNYSATFRGGDKHNETFGKIIGLTEGLIQPVIIKKFIDKIFVRGETVTIGSLLLDKVGYHRKKFFGGLESVSWPEVEYKPKLEQGEVFTFTKNKNGEAKYFVQIPMSTSNAIVIPDLVIECINQYNNIYGKR